MHHLLMRLILIGFLLLAFPALAVEPAYLPAVGDTMTYALSNGDMASSAVVGIEEADDQCVAKVVDQIIRASGQRDIQRYAFIYTHSAVGISMAFPDSDNVDLKVSPLILYMDQAGVEDTWIAQSGSMKLFDDFDSEDEFRFFVIGRLERIEAVTVKAGRFTECRKATFSMKTESGRNSAKSRLTIWYHPVVGIVKTRTDQGGKVLETELVSYSRKRG